MNINGIKRKLNSLRVYKNKLDILFVQQIHNFDNANMEKWLTINKFLIFLNHMIPKEQDPKYFRIGTAILIKEKIKQTAKISEINLVKNRVQIVKIRSQNFDFDLIDCYFPQSIRERRDIILNLEKFFDNKKIILRSF